MRPTLTLLLVVTVLAGCSGPARRSAAPVLGHPTLGELWWSADSPLLGRQDDGAEASAPASAAPRADDDEEGRSPLHVAIFYIPNRVFDAFDIVRARLRFGLGFAIGVRATRPLTAYVGFYTSIWVGIHGPRGEPAIPWPVGGESRAGAQASVADVTAGAPYYGLAEFGLDFQLAIVGAAVGVDPWEALDFLAGFLTIDLVGDDY